ncbi:DUF4199 domain-containing protein [uncultured Aquimarina sp.]|uniref:DUF4199 domain-containing protein n=1 Tax=uncultured Aquimarina sp. TaxID=575652 RepID=UPI00263829DC|nr:DUF4199 domain-containing protein [uncultured Aquimarina sp.]
MEKSVKSNAISLGVILGVILSLVIVLAYTVYQGFYTNWMAGIGISVMIIIFGIVSAIKSRKLLGGFISFKDAFTSYLIPIAIGTIISTIVSILIYVVIDPDAAAGITEQIIESTVGFMEKFGTPESEIEKAVAKMEEENQFGLLTQIKGWFWGMLIYIIIGLLACLAVKKKEPLY